MKWNKVFFKLNSQKTIITDYNKTITNTTTKDIKKNNDWQRLLLLLLYYEQWATKILKENDTNHFMMINRRFDV